EARWASLPLGWLVAASATWLGRPINGEKSLYVIMQVHDGCADIPGASGNSLYPEGVQSNVKPFDDPDHVSLALLLSTAVAAGHSQRRVDLCDHAARLVKPLLAAVSSVVGGVGSKVPIQKSREIYAEHLERLCL